MANWTQEGSAYVLTTMAKGATIAADTLYVGLTNSAPTAASTLATIATGEAAVGAVRKQWTSANANISAGGVLSMGAAVQWGTGVVITGATHWFLCTGASGTTGKLIAWNALSVTRTLTTADTMTENVTDIHIA
jgi:hypothetical protein